MSNLKVTRCGKVPSERCGAIVKDLVQMVPSNVKATGCDKVPGEKVLSKSQRLGKYGAKQSKSD